MVNYTHAQTKWSPVEIQTPAHRNLIGGIMTVPSPLLPPSSIPQFSSHVIALSFRRAKNDAFKKCCCFLLF
jgi:hypothetical protein